jgi:uncharacterized protein (DUF58 family)
MPTARAILLLALGAVGAALWGWKGALAFDVSLLCLGLLDFLLSLREGGIEASRLSPARTFQGVPVDLEVLIRNPSPRGRIVQLRDQTPLGWEAGPILRGAVPGRGSLRLAYRAVPPQRGAHLFGDLWLRVEGPLGVVLRPLRLPATEQVRVYPPLPAQSRGDLAAHRRAAREWGTRPSRWRQEGREFESLRDYVEGDDPRRIHWKATARLERPIVQQYEHERNQIVMILLDAGRLMMAVSQGRSKLDHSLEAAVQLSRAALAQGDRVGIIAFADEVMGFVPPRKTPDQFQRIMEGTLHLEPRLVEPRYERAVLFLRARIRRRSLVVIFTDLLDELSSEALLAAVSLLRPRHLPFCVAIAESEWLTVLGEPPSTADGVYERAVLQGLLRQRRQALGNLVRKGALALDLPPSKLSPGVLERYLEVKRRGLL